MPPEQLLTHLEFAGFLLRVEGEQIMVRPTEKLTENTRSLIRGHRDALIHLLLSRPFVGWYRKTRTRWRSVVRGVSYDDAWRRLLLYESADQFSEVIVLPVGKHPKDRP